MNFNIITLFPEMFSALNYGVVGRAQQQRLLTLKFWNPRDYTTDSYHRVDDRPYGGGPGMVMLAEPLHKTITALKDSLKNPPPVIHLTPQGKPLTQKQLNQLATQQDAIFLASRYEGIDERVAELDIDEEWSLGDYVLSGGELAAMVIIDATARLLPGVLGDTESAQQDSFMQGLLDHPHYSRPELFNGQKVPNVLLSGDHKQVARWRLKQALGRTIQRRPDLLRQYKLSAEEQQLLAEFLAEQIAEARG